MKLRTETGSLINHLMSANTTTPQVGKGATILGWTDRRAYEVLEVSEDAKRVKLETLNAIRTDNLGMSDSQSYRYEPTGDVFDIVFRRGSWCTVGKIVMLTEAALQMNPEERIKAIFPNGQTFPALIEGLTFEKVTYSKISIVFGAKNHYFDYSF